MPPTRPTRQYHWINIAGVERWSNGPLFRRMLLRRYSVRNLRAADPRLPVPVRRLSERHRRGPLLRDGVRAHRFADRKSTRLNSSHLVISYAVFCLKKKKECGVRFFVGTLVFDYAVGVCG